MNSWWWIGWPPSFCILSLLITMSNPQSLPWWYSTNWKFNLLAFVWFCCTWCCSYIFKSRKSLEWPSIYCLVLLQGERIHYSYSFNLLVKYFLHFISNIKMYSPLRIKHDMGLILKNECNQYQFMDSLFHFKCTTEVYRTTKKKVKYIVFLWWRRS